MKNYKRIFLMMFLIGSIVYGLLSMAYAAVPHLINYQGRLTDKDGAPLNGSYELTFRIYDAETAGNLLWEETHQGVVIQKGIFSILLGSVTDLNLTFDKQYWLEIKVGSEVMSPRQRIASSAYAIRAETAENANQAKNADTVGNIAVSSTPAANKLLPLDNNAKLPLSAFKVYDSGWLAASYDTQYTKAHNLGTTKIIMNIYFSNDPNGNGICVLPKTEYAYEPYRHDGGVYLKALTTTTVTIKGGQFWLWHDHDGNAYQNGYIRIIMLALE